MKKAVLSIFCLVLGLVLSLSTKAQQAGIMYSMTYGGGNSANPLGVINMLDPVTLYDTAVFNFNGGDGERPYADFTQLSNGLLYGFTAYGGNGFGNIFQFNIQTNRETDLYDMPATQDSGSYIYYGALCHATNDTFYGLSTAGGYYYGSGVLFSFNYHTNYESVKVQLRGATTGYNPTSMPIQVGDSLLYCTATQVNGEYGSIFTYNIYTGVTNLLYKFTGGTTDGFYPQGSLFLATNGILYGMTLFGGTDNEGVLYSYNPTTHTEAVLVNFTGPNGALPYRGVIEANNGYLYGLTHDGGTYDKGTLFMFDMSSNTLSTLYSFKGAPMDGRAPACNLIQAGDGRLYGNTDSGGTKDEGTIFRYDLNTTTETVLVNCDTVLGEYPYGDLLEVMSASIAVVNNVCSTDTNGTLTINVRGGQRPLTYTWSTGATTSSISHLSSGTYTSSVTDSRGIKFTFRDTIGPGPILVTFLSANPCSGSSLDSSAAYVNGGTAPFTYSWSNGQTTDTIYHVSAGTYTCNIIDANGCRAKGTVVITQAAPISITNVVTVPQTWPNYNNGSITVTASGGIPPGDSAYYLYLWSNAGPYDSSRITGLDSGLYSVCIVSPYGCGSVCDTVILVPEAVANISVSGNLVNVYPVPSSGLITLLLNGDGFENLQITDALGRMVYNHPLHNSQMNNSLNINLSSLSDGVYILQIHSAHGILTRKIIIQK
jgi:uncharacterized repeat protein (TIGR03803 family)